MTNKLLPCPFCGGKAHIAVCDAEGNPHDDSYENDPWSGLSYTLMHSFIENELCPIAHFEDTTLGTTLYDSREELIKAWNERIKNG
ncbi:hypothetical protein DES39_0505 [Orbus hercynius]|uniref:Lar family restriction alleviation protein n=1 Tax=Orbus hercynius TaxID=593135 RepID=A0A495RIP5_9GAMM|nr:hypothetical protein [Orbus hercynius]RKS87285.1 hypothetical protein DES39_0505 [Orbus hercynius]